MKRIGKTIFAVLMAVVVLAGCTMKVDYGFVVGADKNVKIAATLAYDKEFIDGMSSMNGMDLTGDTTDTQKTELTDEQRWAFVDEQLGKVDESVEKKKYDKEGFYGYVLTTNAGKIEDLSADSASERYNLAESESSNSDSSDGNLVSAMKGKVLFVKTGDNKYKSNMTYKMDSSSKSSFDSAEQMGAIFDMTISVTLPTKPISNNATSVSEDGKTLTWDLTKVEDIDFEFTFDGAKADTKSSSSDEKKTNMFIYIGIGGVCLVAVIVVIIVLTGKKSAPQAPQAPINPIAPGATPEQPVVPAEPVAPVAPVAPVEPVVPAEPVVPTEPTVPETTQDTTNNQ